MKMLWQNAVSDTIWCSLHATSILIAQQPDQLEEDNTPYTISLQISPVLRLWDKLNWWIRIYCKMRNSFHFDIYIVYWLPWTLDPAQSTKNPTAKALLVLSLSLARQRLGIYAYWRSVPCASCSVCYLYMVTNYSWYEVTKAINSQVFCQLRTVELQVHESHDVDMMLDDFPTDPLKIASGKLWLGCGGTSTQHISLRSTTNNSWPSMPCINKVKLILWQDVPILSQESSNECSSTISSYNISPSETDSKITHIISQDWRWRIASIYC